MITKENLVKKVLIAMSNREFDPANKGIAHRMLVEHGFEVTQYEDPHNAIMPVDELQKQGQVYDAIIAMKIPFTEENFKNMSPRLKIIARYGSGYDEIDEKTARKYNIAVTITKEPEHSNGVAELAHAFILAMLYHLPQNYLDCTIKRNWVQEVRNTQLSGKTVGFFAFGAIAQCLAGKLRNSGAKLIATDINPNHKAFRKLGVELVSFDELLTKSNIITIHAPGIEENRHIFNAQTFAKMNDGAYLVNTARGILVDETALYEALKSRKLKMAAMDVFNQEPTDSNNPLFSLDNFIGTPHIAGHNFDSRNKLCISSAKAVIDFFKGEKPWFLVN
jgi:D-3-phosphoglycerate dehydrogenase